MFELFKSFKLISCRKNMLKSNPMRISSESLDLDDIISDLNS